MALAAHECVVSSQVSVACSQRPFSGERAPYARAYSGPPVTPVCVSRPLIALMTTVTSLNFIAQQEIDAKRTSSTNTVSPKGSGRSKPKHRYVPNEQVVKQSTRTIEEATRGTEQPPAGLATQQEYTFGQRLQDAQRVEDLFEASCTWQAWCQQAMVKRCSMSIVCICSLCEMPKG